MADVERILISYRSLRLGMRIADKPRGYPRVVEITPRGFAVERWGYGFFPRVGRVKIITATEQDAIFGAQEAYNPPMFDCSLRSSELGSD